MPEWPEDLTLRSLLELQRLRDENRVLARELRLKSATLVNSRLAKEITLEDYLVVRQETAQSAAECKRRAMAIEDEIAYRRIYAPR